MAEVAQTGARPSKVPILILARTTDGDLGLTNVQLYTATPCLAFYRAATARYPAGQPLL